MDLPQVPAFPSPNIHDLSQEVLPPMPLTPLERSLQSQGRWPLFHLLSQEVFSIGSLPDSVPAHLNKEPPCPRLSLSSTFSLLFNLPTANLGAVGRKE